MQGNGGRAVNTMGGSKRNREKTEKCFRLGLLGAVLTLIGDCLIGAARFPDGANMIEGYFAIALAMPAWRPILGGWIGFAGICLEFPALMTICPLIRERMPRGGRFYALSMYVCLAVGGGAVHLPCGVFLWIYKTVAEAAGQEIGHDIALRYLLYFMLPATVVFGVFFIFSSAVQFIAFLRGRTPFPKWYCVFNPLLGKAVFNAVRRLGNTALINGIGTSNMSLSAILMFTVLLLGWKKYVGDREFERGSSGRPPSFLRAGTLFFKSCKSRRRFRRSQSLTQALNRSEKRSPHGRPAARLPTGSGSSA